MNDAELFAAFFAQVSGSELTSEEASAYTTVVDAMRQREREVAP